MFRNFVLLAVFIAFQGSFEAVQAVPITFSVRMSHYIKQGKFNKAADFVDVAGTFNSWSGGAAWRLSDADNDSVYTLTADNAAFVSGATIQFKFRINGSWAGTEEFPNAGPNRQYTVKASNNVILVWYNDEEPRTGPPQSVLSASSRSVFSNGLVYFKDLSKGATTGRRWYFEGGTPGFSTDSLPEVRYATAGTFDVTLVSSSATERDSVVFSDYITVANRVIGGTKWWNDAVFYEIFVRSFYDSNGDGIGDIRGIIQKLDYLNDGNPNTTTDLGITGIWLMPISPSPSYHGYDVTNYRGINPQYGTMADFKDLMTAAHDRGIKIIVDFVANHSSSQHPWFVKSAANDATYRNFYRWSTTNPGGGWYLRNGSYYYGYFWSEMPDINYDHPAVKDSVFAAADYWIKDVGVDGFRLDAVIHLFEEGNIVANAPKSFPFWGEFNARVKAGNPNAFSVGEAWTDAENMLKYVGPDRLDYVFEFDVASAALNTINRGNTTFIKQASQKAYDSFPFLQFGTFLTNHDQNRVANVLGNNTAKMKAAASLYLTLPGIPYVYYGEEIGMQGAKPDEDIRKPLQWTSGTNAGFSTGTPWRAPNTDLATVNIATQSASSTSLLNHYKKLISARNATEDLRRGTFDILSASDASIFAFKRGDRTIVVMNTSGSTKTNIGITPIGVNFCGNSTPGFCGQQWTDLLTGQIYPFTDAPASWKFTLSAYETRILHLDAYVASSERSADLPQEMTLYANFPNPFNPSTTIRFSLPQTATVQLDVLDLNGRVVKTAFRNIAPAGETSVSVSMESLSSGVYFYRLTAAGRSFTRKMTLLK